MTQEITYTESAKIDRICEYIQTNKELQKIIETASVQPQVISIPFNPLEDMMITDWFSKDPENFVDVIKSAIIFYIKSFRDKKQVDNCIKHLKIDITNANEIKMHEWGAEYEGKPVAMNALIIGAGKPETYTKQAEYVCQCSTVKSNSLTANIRCRDESCSNHKGRMELNPASVVTGDIQYVLIQEPLEEADVNKQVIRDAIVKDDNVKNLYIGQRVRIIIVFRSVGQDRKTTNRVIGNIISMKPLDDVEEIKPTDVQTEYFKTLSQKPNYFQVVTESIAPEIKHEFLPKFCVLLSMIGSPRLDRIRGLIHTFLLGDPGVGKSAIIQYTLLLRKKSAMAVGGTMSGTGVTVSMDTLPNRQKMPKIGIVPQCNNGHVGLDEMNQLEAEDMGKLYEAMESMTIHYNKGGFDVISQANTTIIAGANPKYYIYNPDHSIVDNINIPAPLLSRFDLICNMQKNKKSSIDKQDILNHINLIDKIGVKEYIRKEGLLQIEDLAALITYAQEFKPIFNDEANKLAKEFQLKIESIEQKSGAIPIDNRFYHAVKRISKAIARLYFTNTVTPDHVILAIETIKKCMQTFDMNVEAGEMQIKFSSEVKDWKSAFFSVCGGLEQKNTDGRFSEDECIKTMVSQCPEFFANVESASVKFQNMHLNQKVDKIAGRYKLV